MADTSKISTFLNKIKTAVYGKDVRQAIHDGIKQCYSDVGNPTLNIEAFEQAVQNKIDDGSLAAMTIGDGTITQEKLSPDIDLDLEDGEVTAAKLSGTTREYSGGLNRINYDDVIHDAVINTRDGTVTLDAGLDTMSVTSEMWIGEDVGTGFYYAKIQTWADAWLCFYGAYGVFLSSVAYGKNNNGVYGEIPEGTLYARATFPIKDTTSVIHFASEVISNNTVRCPDFNNRYIKDGWGDYQNSDIPASFQNESIAVSKLKGSGAKMYNVFKNELDPDMNTYVLPLLDHYYIYNMSDEQITNGQYILYGVRPNREEPYLIQSFVDPGTHSDKVSFADKGVDDVVAVFFKPHSLTEAQLAGLMISERDDLTEYHPYGEYYYEPDNEMKKLIHASKEDFVKQYDGGVLLGIGDSYMQNSALLSDIATKHGLVCDNRGMASSSISGDEAQTVGLYPFWSRINTAVEEYSAGYMIDGSSYKCDDVKLIVFMGGANDGWIDTRLGSGKTETDTKTIYGALNACFSTLLSSFPNADIVVILQPVNYNHYYADLAAWTEEQAIGYGFKSKEDALKFNTYQIGQYAMHTKEAIVKEMAELYGLDIVDCCFNWFSVVNPNDRAKYWSTDKLHLSSDGAEQLYNVALENKINNLKVTRN